MKRKDPSPTERGAPKKKAKTKTAGPKKATTKKQQQQAELGDKKKVLGPTKPFEVKFLPPTFSTDQFVQPFPPVFYTNAEYSNGICFKSVRVATETCVNATVPANYIRSVCYDDSGTKMDSTTYKPVLEPHDALLWMHKYAAKNAVTAAFPAHMLRLLGTITRRVKSTTDGPKSIKRPSLVGANVPPANKGRVSKMAKSQARKHALDDVERQGLKREDVDVNSKANDVWKWWSSKHGQPFFKRLWHNGTGDILSRQVNDKSFVPLSQLSRWVDENDIDCGTPPKSLYGGLRSIDVDLASVIASLEELSSTSDLYKTPLILPYTRVKKEGGEFEITIAVYAHRLLFEIMTEIDLHIIMSALDEGSFRVVQDLHLPPQPREPAFVSAPFPKVVYHDGEEVSTGVVSKDVADSKLGGSTRMNDQISAFSVPGLMKMWENVGCNTDNYPQLEPALNEYLGLELMEHQRHAVCWMHQMESLKGFGINSILWQEREFLDGGSYFYSPALGQMRLERPPTQLGGLLTDEMGLGKTVEVMGLIASTLKDLQEEEEQDANKKKRGDEDEPMRLHTTLIVVPPALVGQWLQEIDKCTKVKLKIQYLNEDGKFEPEMDGIPDIVVTSYRALGRTKSSRELASYKWGRVVLDEMQEIRSSTNVIAKACDRLDCNRRWMLSGTPLFDGINDLKGELNFLNLQPFCAKFEDGFFSKFIAEKFHTNDRHCLNNLQVLGLLMLRRSKSMTIRANGHPLMGLKGLTVEFVPVSQSPSERALYCFMEYVVSQHFVAGGAELKPRKLCLRLLRDLCISPILLTGGLGCTSQLWHLNDLLRRYHQRNHFRRMQRLEKEERLVMSCHEAIKYMSQMVDVGKAEEGFVTDLRMGTGGGASTRVRTVDIETRKEECIEKLKTAEEKMREAKSKKYKSLWLVALECITTGKLPGETRKHKFSTLWSWRAAIQSNPESKFGRRMPQVLMRGWRPSKAFLEHQLPNKFDWGHPISLELRNIPLVVSADEVEAAVSVALGNNDSLGEGCTVCPQESTTSPKGKWVAVLQFCDHSVLSAFCKKVASKKGVAVPSAKSVGFLEKEIKQAQATLKEAMDENKVFPSAQARRQVKQATKALRDVETGLKIVSVAGSDHIRVCRARGKPRDDLDWDFFKLDDTYNDELEESDRIISKNAVTIKEQKAELKKLRRASEVRDEIKSRSSFQALEALAAEDYDNTMCDICLGELGSGDPNIKEGEPGMVGMLPCTHLFCAYCLDQVVKNHLNCPDCRRRIDAERIVHIDPTLTQETLRAEGRKRKEAKSLIAKASKMMEESQGQLKPEMWEKLYLSIDPPLGVESFGEPLLTALPATVVQHFRAATGFHRIHNTRASNLPDLGSMGLSSKIQALLKDLPKNERSVVFSSSSSAIKHLLATLRTYDIKHRALYSGQQAQDAQLAVQEWKANDIITGEIQYPVLVVQAGAAASGLTLTDACKMFFLEPFVRHEEEQQAYARCHRFGQEKHVHVKSYYTPVSIESRVLEWRKLAAASDKRPKEAKFVYSELVDEDDDEEMDEDGKDEKKDDRKKAEDEESGEQLEQALFLLGLGH